MNQEDRISRRKMGIQVLRLSWFGDHLKVDYRHANVHIHGLDLAVQNELIWNGPGVIFLQGTKFELA